MSSKTVDLVITSGRERPKDIIAKAEALSFNLAFNPGGFLGGRNSDQGSVFDCPDCLSPCIDLTFDEFLANGSISNGGYVTALADQDGSVYTTPVAARAVDAVWFDDLVALQLHHWTLTENYEIDPVEELLPGTEVKVRFIPL